MADETTEANDDGLIGETKFEKAFELAIRGETGEETAPVEEDAPPEEETVEEDDGDETGSDDDSDEDGEEADDSSPTEEAASSSFTLGDRTLTAEEIAEGTQLRDWWKQLPPEAYRAIDGVLSGQYQLVPIQQIEQLQQQYQQTVASPSTEDEEEPIDPQAHERLAHLEKELENIRLAELRQHQDTQLQIINQAQTIWAEDHKDLTEGEILTLRSEVARMQILPGLVASKGGDLSAAMQTALDQAYWTNPEYRRNELNKELGREQEEARQTVNRKRKAASLSGGGGSAPRTPPAANNPESRRQAMIEEIAAAQNGGTLT